MADINEAEFDRGYEAGYDDGRKTWFDRDALASAIDGYMTTGGEFRAYDLADRIMRLAPMRQCDVPPELQRLIDMLRPTYWDSSDGDRHYASLFVNYSVGPTPEWEVEWTGFNLPGNPNVLRTGTTLAETCQKCIDAIEWSRAGLAALGEE